MEGVIFYHCDTDGRCAGYLALKELTGRCDTVGLVECDYARDIDISCVDGAEVWIVDFSFDPMTMMEVITRAEKVIWIDHHISAIKKLERFETVDGIRNVNWSGALLTYCFINNIDPDKGTNFIPEYVILTDDYDTWKHKKKPRSTHWVVGVNTRQPAPDDPFWSVINSEAETLVDKDRLEATIRDGSIVVEHTEGMDRTYCKHFGFAAEWEGYKIFAVNKAMIHGNFFQTVKGEYDFYMAFAFDGEGWQCSLRRPKNNEIDLSVIASRFEFKGRRGGGHSGAAGFKTEHPPSFIKGEHKWDLFRMTE